MKLRYLVLAGALTQAGLAHGMGLGELDLQSYLGNPLQADLRILTPGPYDQEDIRVRIARPEVYEQFGVQFESFHNQIDFNVQPAPGGKIRVQASSRERVIEPFLDIVVELSWPQGTTYRRYSLLLDPPAYAARWRKAAPPGRPVEQAALALAQPAAPAPRSAQRQAWSAPQSVSHAVSPSETPAKKSVRVAAQSAAMAEIDRSNAASYQVRSGDSLWKIARRLQLKPGESQTELMQRLVVANPQAFVAGDPDRLRAGVTLYLPAGSEGAVAQASVSSVPATSNVPTRDLKAELASAEQASVPETVEEIRATLARLQQEKADLVQFQDQLKTEMVNVLERRVAVTQALQQTEPSASAAATSVPATAPAPEAAAAISSAVEAPATDTPPTTAPSETVTLSHLLASHNTVSPRLKAATLTGQDLLPRDSGSRNMSNLLVSQSGSNLWYLVAMLPLGLLVVLLGMRSQRVHKIRQSESLKDGELYELVFGSRRDRSRSDSPEQVRKALEQIREKAGHADLPLSDSQLKEMGHQEQAVSRDDLKQMIDLYMLYSQYQKAQNVILTEISKRPGRADLRLYLMQVYAAMNDWQSFDDQLDVLRRMGNAQLLEEAMKLRSSAPR